MNALATAFKNEATTTRTENGAATYSTSNSDLVDMFFTIGAKRGADYNQIVNVVQNAFKAYPELATRIALWVRDVRQGAGERQTFRHILNFMMKNGYEDFVCSILDKILELGRTDDLFDLLQYKNSPVAFYTLDLIARKLNEGNGLVAKWMPRKGPVFNIVRGYMHYTPKEMRKLLVSLTKVVETQMCNREWEEINYSHVPSKAMTIYNKAFKRHDEKGFTGFLDNVANAKEKINTGAVYPYEVINVGDTAVADALWNNLPDFVPADISFIPIIDTSGSMSSRIGKTSVTCMDVATSLGVYLAERNKSAFKNVWINFHTHPSLKYIRGNDIHNKIRNLDYHNWGGSTNLEAAMSLIVDTAIKNQVSQEDMPNYLIVISDMEFNSWGNKAPGMETRQLFENAGYKMPNILWWNIQSRNNIVPVRAHDNGMALISGFSPTVMKNVLKGVVTPELMMLHTIMNERYNF